jgi:hypothetical protein
MLIRRVPAALPALLVLTALLVLARRSDSVTAQFTPIPHPPGGITPPVGEATIYTDRSSYHVGDIIIICYSVPGPGSFTITDILANGTSQIIDSGEEDGSGGCFEGVVTPPSGTECLVLDYTTSAGSGSTRTCFQVIDEPPSSAWTPVGSQILTGSSWNFDADLPLDPTQTYVRVTSGSCADPPDTVYVFEGALTRVASADLGVDTFAGELEPEGPLAAATGGSGSAQMTRPVVPNPTTHLDVTLFGLDSIPVGTTLSVCVR